MSSKNSEVKIKLSRKAGGLVFIACMFIGMGIGMMFDETAAGMFIGMGVGFLAMALLRGEEEYEEEYERRYRYEGSVLSRILGSIVLALIGMGFILWGLSELEVINVSVILTKTVIGIILVIIGLAFVLASLVIVRR